VKLFSAIAGIALVLAAIFFLRHSLQQGWLQPPVRVLIGVAVAIALLVLCELKAARQYPATANALDAAAIAILFATFFSAHALWDLIPGLVAFALLAAVTALAVLLSIRRQSLFIAVLGLLGGFATPALLSTGENRPVPLFAYLVLLNVGLAWVAHRQVWPILTILTVAFTTLYQWGWVLRFLTSNDLSLAMGIFAIFPVLTVGALILGRPAGRPDRQEDQAFENMAVISAALPLAFVAYLAAIPVYGARPALLFGFLLLIDVGLFAVAVALRRHLLHAVGALATVFVWAVWLTTSYIPAARVEAIAFVGAFVGIYLFAPPIAHRLGRHLEGRGRAAIYAAPILLFVFAIVARIDPDAAAAWPLLGPLVVLVLLCAWRAIADERGGIFFVASFMAVAAQAAWSATHLTAGRLASAAAAYAVFGLVTALVPIVARRRGRPLEPASGAGVVLIASLALLLYLSSGPVAPAALWALALLLAILNGALFVESASSRLPLLAQCGSVLSWLILGAWWMEAAGAVGVLPSLAIMTALALLTLGGHASAARFEVRAAARRATPPGRPDAAGRFGQGLFLGLIGHLFLFFVALNREWSLPRWPLFGSLTVVTLAVSVAALAARAPRLHALGVGAASLVIAAWTGSAGLLPGTLTGLMAATLLSAYALGWISLSRRAGERGGGYAGAATALFGGELTAIVASMAGEPPFAAVVAFHAATITTLLRVAYVARWARVPAGALGAAWLALLQRQIGGDLDQEWLELLGLAAVLYALFTAHAFIVGLRLRERREPWLIALAAAVMMFFAGRSAFEAGGLTHVVGIVPVFLAAVTALLLRALLRLEPPGERDLTRLVLVAGSALGFVTVAIPLQLDHQWITIGWALEGVALAWLYQRVQHRGLLAACAVLLSAVFVRLALNPAIWTYEPRGELRIFNWYLYTYAIAAAAMLLSAWYLRNTDDRGAAGLPRLSEALPAGAVILLFLLLNIEIADYYATGPEITFRFGVTVSQDLTYTIGWLVFGIALLAVGIYVRSRAARLTAVVLIAVTTFKCFLYDLKSLEGLYRVGSFVGLAIALALVSLALQKYVLAKPASAE
jgi:hypothetical protein